MRPLTNAFALFCMTVVPVFAQESQQTRASDVMARGYTALQQSPESALPLFEEAVYLDSANVRALRQLGSIYIAVGRKQQALEMFSRSDRLFPSDTTKLQKAYLLNSLGRDADALDLFSRLEASADPSIRAQSRAGVTVLSLLACSRQTPWWYRAFAAPYFDTRFDNLVFSGSLYAGRHLTEDRILSGIGVLSVTRDTRSEGGAFPVIYSDNYVLLGTGLRLAPAPGFAVDLTGGVTHDLIQRGTRDRTRGDLRLVGTYGIGVFPDLHVPDKPCWPFSPFADLFASAGYYSRYTNGIGYAQARAGARVAEWSYAALDVYLRGDFAVDTDREFYNNVVEWGMGTRFAPDHRWGISFLAEFHRGTYWSPPRTALPYPRSYNSFRFFIVLDKFFCW